MKHKKKLAVLFPILLFYITVSLVCVDKNLQNDQARYAMYAGNLAQGFYAPEDNIKIWNGPGYPLLLVPFIKAEVPLVWAKFLNPFFLFFAVCFMHSILSNYMSNRIALLGSYAMGLYAPFLPEMTLLLTESLSIFLVSGFCFFVVKFFRNGKSRYFWIAALFAGYLILTKVIFAYVITASLLFSLLRLRAHRTWSKISTLYCISLLFCLPYLIYTHSLTGKLFYWANSGGASLYWMTTPYPEEYGDWHNDIEVATKPQLYRHKQIYEELSTMNYVEQDAFLKRQALLNIHRNPFKYGMNWIANLGRMWYDYPFSYKYQRPHTLFYMVPNTFLLTSIIFCIYPLLKQRRHIPDELKILILFVTVYIGGSSLIYTNSRLMLPAVPVLIIVIFFTANNLLEIKLASPTDPLLNKQ